jgi:hypothetical protein
LSAFFTLSGNGMAGMFIFGALLHLAILHRTFSTITACKAYSPSESETFLPCRCPHPSHIHIYAYVNMAEMKKDFFIPHTSLFLNLISSYNHLLEFIIPAYFSFNF